MCVISGKIKELVGTRCNWEELVGTGEISAEFL
jgi:hypothetical protein